jgi:hypothetical protein
MADKIENKDLFGKDLFKNFQDDLKKSIKLLDEFEDKIKDSAKSLKQVINEEDGETLESINKIITSTEDLNKQQKITDSLTKQRLKLQQKLDESRTQEAKDLAELKIITQQQNKLNKEQAKERLGLIKTYDKQSKRLNELRKKYKNLRLQEGKATEETEKLRREIEELDEELKKLDAEVGQFQRNVGNYPQVVGEATNSLLKFGAAAIGVNASIDGVTEALENSAEGSEELRKKQAELNGVWQQTKNVVSNFVIDAFDNLSLAYARFFGDNDDLIKAAANSQAGFERTAGAVEDFDDKVKESAEANKLLVERIIEFEKAIRPLQIRIAKLNGLIEQQQIIAGDSTRTFDEINEAVLKGQELQVQRASLNIKIAKEELDFARERIRIANLAAGATKDLLDAEVEARIALIEAENELKNEILENEKEIRQVKQDRLERDLDILIDGFDNQKTINERIIENEKETLNERAALFQRTVDLANKSFEGQKKVLEELSAAGIDVEELLGLDATELQKRIRLLEQSEIIEGRTLEVIRERRIVLQDLEDAERDLNEALEEGIDLRKDIIAQEEALGKQSEENFEQGNQAIEDLEKDRFENQKQSLQRRLSQAKEGSLEELRLQKELNDLLLEEADRKNQELETKEKERIDNLKELAQNAIDIVNDLIDEGFEKRIASLDKQITETSERADQLREKASEGRLEAQESLAFEQKREAELELQRERARKRQERAKAFFAVLTAFNQNEGDLAKTITDVSVLRSLASGLSAYDGVDDTGGRGNIDSKGGKLWTLHPHEQVWSKKDRESVGFRTRDEIKDIVGYYDKGMLNDLMKHDKSSELINPVAFQLNGLGNNKEVITKLNQLNQSIKGIDIPEGMVNIDEVRGLINLISRKGNRKIVERSKLHK